MSEVPVLDYRADITWKMFKVNKDTRMMSVYFSHQCSICILTLNLYMPLYKLLCQSSYIFTAYWSYYKFQRHLICCQHIPTSNFQTLQSFSFTENRGRGNQVWYIFTPLWVASEYFLTAWNAFIIPLDEPYWWGIFFIMLEQWNSRSRMLYKKIFWENLPMIVFTI